MAASAAAIPRPVISGQGEPREMCGLLAWGWSMSTTLGADDAVPDDTVPGRAAPGDAAPGDGVGAGGRTPAGAVLPDDAEGSGDRSAEGVAGGVVDATEAGLLAVIVGAAVREASGVADSAGCVGVV